MRSSVGSTGLLSLPERGQSRTSGSSGPRPWMRCFSASSIDARMRRCPRRGCPMRVLLATDFSDHAATARALVASLALPEGSLVRVVHAVEPVASGAAFTPEPMLYFTEEVERQLRGELEEYAQQLRRPDLQVEVAVPFGRAADVIVSEAEGVAPDLVVIG